MVFRPGASSTVTGLIRLLTLQRSTLLIVALQTLLLSSCAHISSVLDAEEDSDAFDEWSELISAPNPSGANHYQLTDFENSLYRIPVWQLSGRLSIRADNEALSGSLRWRQDIAAFIINFNAPFGQGALQIKGDSVGVELETADGRTLQADDIDQMFAEVAGWELPLSGLRYWIFGIPSPDNEARLKREQDQADGRITEIQQSDWVVALPRYVQIGEKSLPRKLRLRSIGHKPELQVRLVIDNWQLDDLVEINQP